jgi:hypothetical protein
MPATTDTPPISRTVMTRSGHHADEKLDEVTDKVIDEVFSTWRDQDHPTDRDQLVTAIRALDAAESLIFTAGAALWCERNSEPMRLREHVIGLRAELIDRLENL